MYSLLHNFCHVPYLLQHFILNYYTHYYTLLHYIGKRLDHAYSYSLTKVLHSEEFLYDHLMKNHVEVIEMPFRFKRVRYRGKITCVYVYTCHIYIVIVIMPYLICVCLHTIIYNIAYVCYILIPYTHTIHTVHIYR